MSVKNIDQEGNINFKFNQKLNIPPILLQNKQADGRRQLFVRLKDLNVT